MDHFLIFSQNNETRSSSMDSDGEYENGMPIMRTISHDDHNTPAPGALRKVRKLYSSHPQYIFQTYCSACLPL